MLKVSYIIENKKKVINALSKRNFDATKIIGRLEDYNSKRKKIQLELENILSESNKLSKEIGTLIKSGNKERADKIKGQTVKFKEITNCSVLLNTSFNVRGEPIVNTPKDAFRCFMNTELDKLVIENFFLDKKDQDHSVKKDYKKEYELD